MAAFAPRADLWWGACLAVGRLAYRHARSHRSFRRIAARRSKPVKCLRSCRKISNRTPVPCPAPIGEYPSIAGTFRVAAKKKAPAFSSIPTDIRNRQRRRPAIESRRPHEQYANPPHQSTITRGKLRHDRCTGSRPAIFAEERKTANALINMVSPVGIEPTTL